MIKLKAFKQTNPSTCGATCLKMVLDYYKIRKSEKELVRLAHTSRRYGTKAQDIVRVGNIFGLNGFVKEFSNIKDINKYISKDIPVIINWFSGWEGHYSVAFDIDKNNIYFKDPETAESVKMSIYVFKKIWFGIRKGDIYSPKTKSENDLYLRRIIVLYMSKTTFE